MVSKVGKGGTPSLDLNTAAGETVDSKMEYKSAVSLGSPAHSRFN